MAQGFAVLLGVLCSRKNLVQYVSCGGGARTSSSLCRGKSGRMKIRSWLIKDLEKLQRLAEEAAQTGGGRLDSRVSYIKSKDNEVADEGSRGRVQKMKEHAVSKGWRIEQELSLRDISSIIPDLPQLFARIIHMTNLMSDPNKSTDLDP